MSRSIENTPEEESQQNTEEDKQNNNKQKCPNLQISYVSLVFI